jgi:Ca-activated chloride channel family protein
VETAAALAPTWKVRFQHVPYGLRLSAVILFMVALAGPRSVLQETVHRTEGVDIVLTIDASFSMLAEDFKIKGQATNRFDVVKNVVKEFIEQRTSDRIGLVIFGAQAYTVSPLTTDYAWLFTNLDRIKLGMIDGNATAIGSAVASSVGRLKDSEAKSRIIILLTDGESNAGKVSPVEAAAVARSLGIKIYTIGAGTDGFARTPVGQDPWGRMVYQQQKVTIDEETLRNVAEDTGGKYFRATDTQSLRDIYKEIDSLEKTKIEEYGYMEYQELFGYFLTAALWLVGLETILANTVFLKVP